MVKNLLHRGLTDRRVSLLVYACGLAAYSIFIVAIWSSVKNTQIEQLWNSYPESLRKAFGASINLGTFDGFFTLEFLNQMWPLVLSVFSIGFATASLAGEVEKGTMEMLLAQPVARRTVVTARHLLYSLTLLALIATTLVPVIVGAPIVGGSISYTGLAALSLQAFLFFAAIGSYSFFFAAIFSSRSLAIFVSAGVLIFAYALDIMSKFNDFINHFHFLSLFNYYDPYRYLHDASFAWGDLAVLAGTIVISTAAAVLWFERRDIAV